MASFSEYKRQRIVSLWRNGYKAPTIAKFLAKENLPATRQGIQKFLKKSMKSVVLLADEKVQVERQR